MSDVESGCSCKPRSRLKPPFYCPSACSITGLKRGISPTLRHSQTQLLESGSLGILGVQNAAPILLFSPRVQPNSGEMHICRRIQSGIPQHRNHITQRQRCHQTLTPCWHKPAYMICLPPPLLLQTIDSTMINESLRRTIDQKSSREARADASQDSRPRCYEHGCGSRAFSCYDNSRRYMREKTGTKVAVCEFCLTTFGRKSNRDKHLAIGKCKVLRYAGGR